MNCYAIYNRIYEGLINGVDRMVFQIVDGHPTHKAKMVCISVESIKNRFRLFYLSLYSTELNPD